MKWLLLLLILAIPVMGIHFIYRSYRIWFKSDYSDLKNKMGEIPENPGSLAPLVAKIHLATGVLVLISCALITKLSLMPVVYMVTAIVIFFRFAMHGLVKK